MGRTASQAITKITADAVLHDKEAGGVADRVTEAETKLAQMATGAGTHDTEAKGVASRLQRAEDSLQQALLRIKALEDKDLVHEGKIGKAVSDLASLSSVVQRNKGAVDTQVQCRRCSPPLIRRVCLHTAQ